MKVLILGALLLISTFSFAGPHMHGEMGHHHHGNAIEVGMEEDAPMINHLMVMADSMKGFNLHVSTMNFTFSPESVGGENVMGEGHAHLYIDGKKITRLYSNWYYIGNLDVGEHTITVSLNGNDHSDYVIKGRKVEASTTVVVE